MRWAVTCLVVAVSTVLLMAAPAAATVLSTTFPFAGTYTSPCTGEVITFAGTLNVLIGEFIDPAGEISLNIHSNFQGVTGAGLMGSQYQIPTDNSQSMSLGFAPVTLSLSNDFRVIGTYDTFRGNFPLTITIGGTGGISANVGSVQLACS